MKRLWLLIALSMIPISAALGMSSTDIPSKFNIPWANSAGASYTRSIPQASQIGIQNCAASLTDGFPPLTFVPQASGGCPPFGQDFNGILKQITQWSRWGAAGAPVYYDSGFSAQIGGYPKGAVLQSTILQGRMWLSTADNNGTNPDDQTGAAANWIALPGTDAAGQLIPSLTGTTPNTVPADGLTVGNASSNATRRANVDTFWLFGAIWANCANAVCPIYTSAGSASTRGATALADWNANKAIATYPMQGTAVIGNDGGSGRLSGVPVVTGSVTTNGSIVGENLHSLTSGENGTHNHTLTDPGHTHGVGGAGASPIYGSGSGFSGGGAFGSSGAFTIISATTGITIAPSGSGTAHNTVPRSAIVQWNLAL